MSSVRKIIYISATALLVAAMVVLAYFMGKSNGTDYGTVVSVEDMDELVTNEQEATVVKRVSQQMEAIAYQQKTISEMQRDRAEEQSRIAISMRDKAEKESQAARSAENRALQLAYEAEVSAKEAARQRDQATLAKRVSDTLTYLTLGRTLASSSIYDYEDGQFDMAAALAYASWYFLDKYKGNVYLPECFQALNRSANASMYTYMHGRGAVRGIAALENGACILVSDYGEIEYQTVPGKEGKVLLHNKEFDFRAVCSHNDRAYALSLHGPVCFIEKDSVSHYIALPDGNYSGIACAGKDLLFIWGGRNILWINSQSGRLVSMSNDIGGISAALYYGGSMHVFLEDGRSAVLDSTGGMTYEESPFDETVTAVHYDAGADCIYYGGKSGHILRKNLADGSGSVLYGHTSRISFISAMNGIAVTGSYDKSVCLWNIAMLKNLNDMLIPAAITSKSWPMSAKRLNDAEMLVGYSNGTVARYNVSASSLAARVRTGIKRNLTQAEWQQYMGANVPYIKFK